MLNAILYHYTVGFYVVNISSIVKIVVFILPVSDIAPIRQLLLLNLIMILILILMSGASVESWIFLLFLLLPDAVVAAVVVAAVLLLHLCWRYRSIRMLSYNMDKVPVVLRYVILYNPRNIFYGNNVDILLVL